MRKSIIADREAGKHGESITGIIGKPQLLYNSHACSSSVLAVTELRLMREKLSTESLSNQDLAKRVDSDSVKLSPMSTHFGSYGICHSTPSNPQSLISSKPCVTPADCLQSSAPSKLLYCCSWGPITVALGVLYNAAHLLYSGNSVIPARVSDPRT